MDRKLIVVFLLIPFLFIVFVTLNHKSPPASNVLPAQIEAETLGNPRLEVLGYNVYLRHSESSEWVTAKDQEEILPGATIKTDKGGLAQLIYPNGTVTRLDNNTQITLKEYNPTPQTVTVYVEVGKIWSRITKLLGGELYQSESKNLVATVRGTIYEHEVLPSGEDKISVTSHVVHVSCSKNKVETDVAENEAAQTGCTFKPKPVQIPEVEKQTKWVKFNHGEDKKLRKRFKNALYDESDEKEDAMSFPTSSPTPTPTSIPSLTPITIPSPTSILPITISNLRLICSPSTCPDNQGHTKVDVFGSNFDSKNIAKITAVDQKNQQEYNADPFGVDTVILNGGELYVHFSTRLSSGTYYIRIYPNPPASSITSDTTFNF